MGHELTECELTIIAFILANAALLLSAIAYVIVCMTIERMKKDRLDKFEKKYSIHNVKIVEEKYPCYNCAYFYDGKTSKYPFINNEDLPHPPCCVNSRRCIDNKIDCYIKDVL